MGTKILMEGVAENTGITGGLPKDVPGSSFNGVTFLFAIRLPPHSSVTFLLVLLLVLVIPTTVVASTATS